MPAYFVYICKEVADRESLEIYWEKIVPTLQGYDARSVAAYTRFEQLEGEDTVEGVAVVEFPSFERAKEWYNSRAYRDIRHYRKQAAKYIGVRAEGGIDSVASPRGCQTVHTVTHHGPNVSSSRRRRRNVAHVGSGEKPDESRSAATG